MASTLIAAGPAENGDHILFEADLGLWQDVADLRGRLALAAGHLRVRRLQLVLLLQFRMPLRTFFGFWQI